MAANVLESSAKELMEAAEFRTERWVCTGYVELAGSKRGINFVVLDADGVLGLSRAFAFQKFKTCRIGSVYSIEASIKSSRPDTLRYIGPWKDESDRATWQAEAEVYKLERERRAGLKAAEKNDALRAKLDPLRKMFHKMSWRDREAFELVVMTYLRTGRFE